MAAEPRAGAPTARPALRTFESLADPDFRWFFGALMGHFTAMNMQMFIRGWMVFQLTGSFLMLGAITLASAIPQILLSLVGGVVADLVPQRKWIVQIGQFADALNALAIATLIFSGLITIEHLVIAAVVQGTTMSLMLPARQALVPELVGPERLMNAMALTTAGMNTARLVMPGLAGWMVAAIGGGRGVEGAQYVYLLMSAMYLTAVLLLVRVATTTRTRAGGPRSLSGALSDLVGGLAYVRRNRPVSLVLWVNLVLEMVAMPYFFLLPGFVSDVLEGGAFEVGTLMSISGIGSLAGSLVIASLPSRRRGLVMMLASALLGVALLAFSASTLYALSAVIFVVVGFGQTARFALSSVLIQVYTDDEYRGRVSSIFNISWGLTNFGTFGVGLAADAFGAQLAIGGTAIALLVAVALLLSFTGIRGLD